MFGAIKNALVTQKPIARIEDPEKADKLYRQMRIRMMYSMIVGYASFYLVRKNFSMAMPSFLNELGYTRTDLGIVLSAFSIIYGVGKFLNGMLADRANPRYFMAIGLFGAAVMNLFFGFSSSLLFFGIFWLGNAWFQAMGWPPCARMLSHWYSPREAGTMWGIWNSSHQIGGALIFVLSGFLIQYWGWRAAFFVPACMASVGALFLLHRLRDTPVSLGLPPIEEYRNDGKVEEEPEGKAPFWPLFREHILGNRLIWILCIGNFFVYIVRIGVMDWAPTFLVEAKGSSLGKAGFQVAAFEIAGIFGALGAGMLSDKVFGGRRGPVSVLFMAVLVLFLFYFWWVPPGHPFLDAMALVAVGFLVYGPQMLVGVSAADFASKKAVAAATGLTGTFGYMGSAVCGVGVGFIVDNWGWDGGFMFFIASAIIGMFCFMLTWNAKAKVLED